MAPTLPIAINGLGRIGRALLKIAISRPDLEPVAVNELDADPRSIARLIAYDSVHGKYPGTVVGHDQAIEVDATRIACFRHADPQSIPWQETGARVVVDATGTATARHRAAGHLRTELPSGDGSVERVVISAISDDADIMICHGINQHRYDPARHHVVSNASCTTHCLALLLQVLDQEFGVEGAFMNEVHSYTGNQNLVDGKHPDPRRSRAAAINIVPTGSAAPSAVERLMPQLSGRVTGCAVRVPTPNVALLDLVATLSRRAQADDLLGAFRRAAASPALEGLLAVSDEPLVSTDFIGNPHSAIVDSGLIQELDQRAFRIMAWYDNEWGYANRLADLSTLIARST